MEIAECFSKVADLAGVLGVKRINELPGLWVHKIDDEWQVSVNGHKETIEHVPPFSMKIENLKYLCFGVVSVRGGTIIGGQEAEDAFIAAVDRAIVRETDPTPYCSGCKAKHAKDCKCGPIAEND